MIEANILIFSPYIIVSKSLSVGFHYRQRTSASDTDETLTNIALPVQTGHIWLEHIPVQLNQMYGDA